jgi:acid phosphatase type 7
VVGTGGKNHYPLKTPPANVEDSNSDTFGVLQLTLHPTSYDWVFIPIAGQSFTDAGSGICQ